MFSGHRLYILFLVLVVIMSSAYITWLGLGYYLLPIEERFFHPGHMELKPGGVFGHGLGIIGSLCIILGVALYIARKRIRAISRWGLLKHWLEFHIFLCTLGPLLIVFHTSFKFGGIVAISFWSMAAVFLSGVIGRFIYLQIPRTIEGREMSLAEVQALKTNIGSLLKESYELNDSSLEIIIDSTKKKIGTFEENPFRRFLGKMKENREAIRKVKAVIGKNLLTSSERREILRLVKHEISLNRRIDRLVTMQNMFKYWHVAHLPFAIVMLVIMIVHVVVTMVLGYRWIF